jgi:hypothetical protein
MRAVIAVWAVRQPRGEAVNFFFATTIFFVRDHSRLDYRVIIDAMDSTMQDAPRQSQVKVHFITDAEDIQLPEGKRQLLVPTSTLFWSRSPRLPLIFDQTSADMASLRSSTPSLCWIPSLPYHLTS